MAMTAANTVTRLIVPRELVEHTLASMREFGGLGFELLLLWLGKIDQSTGAAVVTTVFAPDQKPIKGEDGVGYFVTGKTLFELNKRLSETGLRLLAQVHSHPTEAYHSEADDQYAIVTEEGGFSLVVPNFGEAPAHPALWAIYRLFGRDWVEMPSSTARHFFYVAEKQ